MFLKNKFVRTGVIAALSLIFLYSGISCAAVLHKAITQPYLLGASGRVDFLGYYMMAMLMGAVCLAALAVLAFLFVQIRKRKNKAR